MTTAATSERPTLQLEWAADELTYDVLIGGILRGTVVYDPCLPNGPAKYKAWREPYIFCGHYMTRDAAINAILDR
jgi:hypothetical protein